VLKIIKLWVKADTDERGYLALTKQTYNFVCENDPNDTTTGLTYTMNIERTIATGEKVLLSKEECFSQTTKVLQVKRSCFADNEDYLFTCRVSSSSTE
jgi:hypothetical protein